MALKTPERVEFIPPKQRLVNIWDAAMWVSLFCVGALFSMLPLFMPYGLFLMGVSVGMPLMYLKIEFHLTK